jgi:LacI family transcriptional regulator
LKKKPVTIKDIAKEVGMHHTTVSMALRNSPLLKDATREKIQAIAKQMGYRPNRLAQGFRRRSSHSIGLIVPAIHHHFFSHFISEITEIAFEAGYSVIVLQSNENLETEKINIESLIDNRVAGIIASVSLETRDSEHFSILEEEEIPIVFFDRIPADFGGCMVRANNYQLAYDAVELLIKRGRKRIAFITGSSQINVFKERINGYMDALKNNQLEFDDNLIVDKGVEMISGARGAKILMSLETKPDGIFTVNDRVATGAIKYLKRSGFEIPGNVSIIGFDNDPIGLAVEPELTTCIQPVKKMARLSLETLLNKIEFRDHPDKEYILDGDILIRNSS